MTIEQGYIGELGIRRYVGPLVVWIQELDGTFKHTLQIEHQVGNCLPLLLFCLEFFLEHHINARYLSEKVVDSYLNVLSLLVLFTFLDSVYKPEWEVDKFDFFLHRYQKKKLSAIQNPEETRRKRFLCALERKWTWT